VCNLFLAVLSLKPRPSPPHIVVVRRFALVCRLRMLLLVRPRPRPRPQSRTPPHLVVFGGQFLLFLRLHVLLLFLLQLLQLCLLCGFDLRVQTLLQHSTARHSIAKKGCGRGLG
jgi:hypothetical protein